MCKQCEKNPVYEFTNQRKLCANCFIRWFQKKVLYSIRKFEMIRSGDVVGYFSAQGRTPKNIQKNIFTRGIVLEDVLKMFAEKAPVELIKLPAHSCSQIDDVDNNGSSFVNNSKNSRATLKRGKSVTKLALSDTTDSVADEIVHEVVEGKVNAHPPVQKRRGLLTLIKPLYLFLDKEVLLYAKLRAARHTPECLNSGAKLKYKEVKVKKDKLSGFIDKLEIKHPEIKQAVVQGMLKI